MSPKQLLAWLHFAQIAYSSKLADMANALRAATHADKKDFEKLIKAMTKET